VWRAFGVRFLVALVLVFVLTAGGIGGAYWFAAKKVSDIPVADIRSGVLDKVDPAKPANFLIIGSDTRAFVDTPQQAQDFGTPTAQAGQRSDTIMVAHVDPDATKSLLVSFPRDLWVHIPGVGMSKINAAYNYGPERIIETIQQDFGIPINHYLEVDFAGFEGVVNAIGSVPIYFPTPARDKETGLDAPAAGCYSLNGKQALAYVRSRYYQYYTPQNGWQYDPRSDIGRIQRQQYFIRSLAQTAISKGARDPRKATKLLDRMVPNLKRDPGLGLSDLLSLVKTFRTFDPNQVQMVTIPFTSDWPQSSKLFLDQAAAAPILARMRSFSSSSSSPPKAKPGEVTLAVENGSGVNGAAGTALSALEAAGFHAAGPATDAPSHDHATTEVQYASGQEDAARLVQSYLGGVGTLVPSTSTGGAQVVVVLGRDFHAVASPSASTTTPTTAAPTTTSTVPFAPGAGSNPNDPNAGLPVAGCPRS